MATSCPPSDTAGYLVLRVKRKREEDPAEALVVTKQAKREDSVSSRSVFRFVGTLKEESSDKVILDKLKHYRQRTDYFKSNPLAKLSLEDTRAQTREAVKRNSSTQRFKVTSKLRCLQSSVTDGSSPEGNSQSAEVCAGGDRMGEGLTEDRVHICDAMQQMEDEEEEKEQETTGAITCNNSVMVREKVAQKKGGYVYDLYYYTYDPGGTFKIDTDTFDWNSLSLYESELVHDIIESEEVLDDEDDSNDENNWRNDYPDEEDSPHSSDSERDNRGEYRNWQDAYSSDECGMGDYQ